MCAGTARIAENKNTQADMQALASCIPLLKQAGQPAAE